jgi:hypothetical protein
VLPFGTNALLVDTDPAHYHAILGFAYLTAFGFAAFCTGTLFGYLLKPGPTIKGSDAYRLTPAHQLQNQSMNHPGRLLTILLALAWGSTNSNSAHAESGIPVFDNTANPAPGGVFGPSAHQAGNEITLAGGGRQITRVSWLVDTQHTDLLTDIETHIYADDGAGGAPGTLLWSSGLLTGIPVHAADTFLTIAVPNITVPDTITVTSRISNSVPVALGRVYGGPPTEGSLDASWVETSPGVWAQQFGPWGMQVVAVPEPSAASLLLTASVLLVGLLRARGPRRFPLRFARTDGSHPFTGRRIPACVPIWSHLSAPTGKLRSS